MSMQPPILITVVGKAQSAGSKRALPAGGKSGGRPFVVESNPKAKAWKEQVALQAAMQYVGPLLDCALAVEMVFYTLRPKGHFGTGRNAGILKDSAPAYPTVKPDVLKLARAVEDGLTGVVYRDDALTVDLCLGKRYGDRERVEIKIMPVEAQRVDELVARGEIEPVRPSERFEQLSLLADAA
jgi:Holliday junction resolvase RusA-like endonuclease